MFRGKLDTSHIKIDKGKFQLQNFDFPF
jgi:hypothetical protein